MRIVSLGDRAVLVYLDDEAQAARFARTLQAQSALGWMEAVVPAYSTVGVYIDPDRITLAEVRQVLANLTSSSPIALSGKSVEIPVCYDLQLDLNRVSDRLQLAASEVVRLHSSTEFTIYAIGFCPGFPYLGYLPMALTGMPRLESPRLRLEPGSVGLVGRQTGIYPLGRPGGWNIIGRTPMELVNVEEGYFPLQVGDQVRFRAITRDEYEDLKGARIST